jgi:UDP-sulfoquinovose synthase
VAGISGARIACEVGDICDAGFVEDMFRRRRPDCVVHFGEQRSAPFSMISRERLSRRRSTTSSEP